MKQGTHFKRKIGQKVHFCKNNFNLIKISFYDEAIKLYSFDMPYDFNEDNLKSLISIMRQKLKLDFKIILKTFNEECYELVEFNQKGQA